MINRLKLALILTPAIFILTAWAYLMSHLATADGSLIMLSVAAALSFAAAYSITLFFDAVTERAKGKR